MVKHKFKSSNSARHPSHTISSVMADFAAAAVSPEASPPAPEPSQAAATGGPPSSSPEPAQAASQPPVPAVAHYSKNESEQSQIEILKTVVQYKNSQIFEWGQKAKVLEQCVDPLNRLEVFNGTLKISTLKERWLKAEKMAEGIIADEERFVRLAQNGGKDLSETVVPLSKVCDQR